ncbi:MAG: molybdate ABC transporter substrate-binding protein [Deltaproteobacteria bacterium]|nr:MAG: molybdate ABC transporter substrate-binding protein [Deltaproteobacteria bacterium]
MGKLALTLLVLLFTAAVAVGAPKWEGRTVEVFAGSASAPPLREAALLFKERTGAEVDLHFGGSGTMLSQITLSGRGDLYIPGSSDFMELAKEKDAVDPSTERVIAYLLPAICVPKGNPKGIKTLEDLSQPGLRVGIGRPDTVCVGLYGVEAIERAGLGVGVKLNVVSHAESCSKTAQLVALGLVDAVMGWDVFAKWSDKIEAVPLPPESTPRIGYIPGALTKNTTEPAAASDFLAFITDGEGARFFSEAGYITSVEEARRRTTPNTPVGGFYALPDGWK